ncbi:hypothetical protein ACP70R_012157 [Stipagrostis hirtigluma subsp. patula]
MVEIDWNLENTKILCKLLAEQVGKGNRPNTHLNALGYSEVEKGFKERTGLDISKLQIKNKWDKLKEDFKARNKLMLKQTGTGWDNVKGTIKMDNEWWKKTRQEIPGAGKFKILGLQNKEELQQCFADITNDGGDHYCPMGNNNVVLPQSDNQADMNGAANGDDADGRQADIQCSHKRRLLLLPWCSTTSYVSMQVEIWTLQNLIGIRTLCLPSLKDTTNMQCLNMHRIVLLPNQVS